MIRVATPADAASIAAIYNQAVAAGFQTAYTMPFSAENQHLLLEGHDEHYPIFIYISGDTVAGWLSISPYRAGRGALRHTVEISYFMDSAFRGQGIGSALMAHALDVCRQLKYRNILLIIIEGNDASVALARKYGFVQWGRLPLVAEFAGIECSQVYYGRRL